MAYRHTSLSLDAQSAQTSLKQSHHRLHGSRLRQQNNSTERLNHWTRFSVRTNGAAYSNGLPVTFGSPALTL